MKEMVTAAVAMLLVFSVVSGGFRVYRDIVNRDTVTANEEAIEENESDNMDEPVEAEEEESAETVGEEEEGDTLYGEDEEEEEDQSRPYQACLEFLAGMQSADCRADHVRHALFYDPAAVLSADRTGLKELLQSCEDCAALQAAGRSYDRTRDISTVRYRIVWRDPEAEPQLMLWITSCFPAVQKVWSTFLELEYDPAEKSVKLCYLGGGEGTDAVTVNKEGLMRETYTRGSVGEYDRFYRYFYADGSGALTYLYAVGLKDLGISPEEDGRSGASLYLASYFMERARSAASCADPDQAGIHALHTMRADTGDPTLQYEPDYLSGLLAASPSASLTDRFEIAGSGEVIRSLLDKADSLSIPAHALQADGLTGYFYSEALFSLYRAVKAGVQIPPLKSKSGE